MAACRLWEMPNGGSEGHTREVLPSPLSPTPTPHVSHHFGIGTWVLPRIAQNYGSQKYLLVQSLSEVSENSKSDVPGRSMGSGSHGTRERQNTAKGRPKDYLLDPKTRPSVRLGCSVIRGVRCGSIDKFTVCSDHVDSEELVLGQGIER